MTIKRTYKHGIWMPTAQVICFGCHDTKLEWEGKKSVIEPKPTPLETYKGVTHCDLCDAEIQVYDEVAHEHETVRKLQKAGIRAEMAQTGGMNSACEIDLEYDVDGTPSKWIAIKSGLDHDTADTNLYVSVLTADGDWEDLESFDDVDKLIEALRKWAQDNGYNIEGGE